MRDTDVRPKRVCSPKYAVQKARKGIQLNRWELEDLAKDPEQSIIYCQKVLKGRFPEAEKAIGENPILAFQYAREIVKGRFPEGEKAILDARDRWGNSTFVKRYIIDVACVRDENFERHIKKEVAKGGEIGVAIEYAIKCVGGRWEEIEPYILREDLGYATQYHSKVVKGRWPQLENRILFKKKKNSWENRDEAWEEYLGLVGPCAEIEDKLMRTRKAGLILSYAKRALKRRLPQALHQKMIMFSFDDKSKVSAKKYLKWIGQCEQRVINYLSGLEEEEASQLVQMARTK